MTFEQGALVEPVAVAVRTLAQAQAGYQDRVVIIGGGTIGLLCLAVAKARGVKETVINVKYAQQARIAAQLGADDVVQIGERELREVVAERTHGLGEDAVIETVGSAAGFDEALAVVRPAGTVVLVALYPQPLTVDLQPIVMREVRVTGSICYGYSGMTADFQAAIDLISSGRVDQPHWSLTASRWTRSRRHSPSPPTSARDPSRCMSASPSWRPTPYRLAQRRCLVGTLEPVDRRIQRLPFAAIDRAAQLV